VPPSDDSVLSDFDSDFVEPPKKKHIPPKKRKPKNPKKPAAKKSKILKKPCATGKTKKQERCVGAYEFAGAVPDVSTEDVAQAIKKNETTYQLPTDGFSVEAIIIELRICAYLGALFHTAKYYCFYLDPFPETWNCDDKTRKAQENWLDFIKNKSFFFWTLHRCLRATGKSIRVHSALHTAHSHAVL
jgi:hypothetical protein